MMNVDLVYPSQKALRVKGVKEKLEVQELGKTWRAVCLDAWTLLFLDICHD